MKRYRETEAKYFKVGKIRCKRKGENQLKSRDYGVRIAARWHECSTRKIKQKGKEKDVQKKRKRIWKLGLNGKYLL